MSVRPNREAVTVATVVQLRGGSVCHPIAAVATGAGPGILHAKYYRALVGHTTFPAPAVDNSVGAVHRIFRPWCAAR
jgi:hypothetical protein